MNTRTLDTNENAQVCRSPAWTFHTTVCTVLVVWWLEHFCQTFTVGIIILTVRWRFVPSGRHVLGFWATNKQKKSGCSRFFFIVSRMRGWKEFRLCRMAQLPVSISLRKYQGLAVLNYKTAPRTRERKRRLIFNHAFMESTILDPQALSRPMVDASKPVMSVLFPSWFLWSHSSFISSSL